MDIQKEIASGFRCKTYIVKEKGTEILYQEYTDGAYYQARKKYNVTKRIIQSYKKFIPNVYKYVNYDDKSVLYSELKGGMNLQDIRRNHIELPISSIAVDLVETLYNIHSIKDSKYFGWITDEGCIGTEKDFCNYVISEFNRFEQCFRDYFSKGQMAEIIDRENELIDFLSSKTGGLEPQLIWYDINPSNILIKDGRLSSLVDPGGAKYAIKELDLAFLKMEVCRSDEEFEQLYLEYKKLDNSVDRELIEKMSILVELDDIYIRLQDRIFLPIPYCSNFKNIIEGIHNSLKSNS